MRITMKTIYDQINTDLNRLTTNLAKTNASISSGKIYHSPSDAPITLTRALGLRSSIKETDQYQDNIRYGQGWVAATENAIDQVHDRLLRAKTLAIQGANDSQNADSRKAIAKEVKRLLEDVVALGNTQLGGRYVLAGSRTKGYDPGEAPFVLNQDNTVTYNGNREDISLTVAGGVKQKINLDGHTALVKSGVFSALKDLYDSLMSNSQPDIEVAIAEVDKSLEYVGQQLSELGAQANSLDNKRDMAESLSFVNTERLSDTEDTDIVEAITDLKTYETSYQAALAAASKVMQQSLVDYI